MGGVLCRQAETKGEAMSKEIHKDCMSPEQCVLKALSSKERKLPILVDVLKKHWGKTWNEARVILDKMRGEGKIYCFKPKPYPEVEEDWLYGVNWGSKEPDQQIKADKGKPPIAFLLQVPEAMAGLSRVFEHGAKKYGVGTWDRVEIDRYIHALGRHFFALGPDAMNKDPESGLLHIDHVLWNAAVISQMLHKWQKECPLGKAVADGNLGGE